MFTQALIIGMTPHQFWEEDPHIFFNYLEAYKRKQEERVKSEQEKMNLHSWLQGIYTMKAIGAIFGKQKYPEKPIDLEHSEPQQKEASEREMSDKDSKDKQIMKTAIEFEQFVGLFNQTYFGEEEGE